MKSDIKEGIQFLLQKVKEQFYPLLLGVFWLVLSIGNHLSGSWLSGWDTLHPEFNFGLSFQRLLFGVFRPEQGLGAVAGHSHMSELPRVFMLWISSFILPTELLRYGFITSCLLVGILGVYYFCLKTLFTDHSSVKSKTFSFLGALFYLLNLGTLQHFVVPFEMFTVLYAFLPWILLNATLYLRTGYQKYLRWFFVVSLMAAPMAFAATLWYAFFLSFLFYLLPFLKTEKKKVALLVVSTLLINSFWLLPNFYFIASGNANFVPQARINRIFSEEAFMYNKSYADLVNGVILKNFLFDWPVYKGDSQFGYLLEDWRNHIHNKWVLAIGYLNFLIICLGIFKVFKNRQKEYWALFSVMVITMIFILNLNPPLDFFFSIIRDNFTLFKESLRFPFTKFSIPLIFAFSCLFALGQQTLYQLVSLINRNSYRLHAALLSGQILVASLLMIIFMWPAFEGQLISPHMQVKIPQQYFQLFEWLDTQPEDARVAILPINSMWGWIYYDWGFQGAQFVSFGIKQPLLDRDYDRWSKGNEDYYNQMSYAIYAQNPQLVQDLLDKYQIHFLIIDENVIDPSPGQDQKSLYLNEIKSLLAQINAVKPVGHFDALTVYEVKTKYPQKDFVSAPSTFKVGLGPEKSGSIDWIYQDQQTYISTDNKELLAQIPTVTYPFHYFHDSQNIIDPALLSFNDQQQLSLHFAPSYAIKQLSFNDYLQNESSIPTNVKINPLNSEIGLTLKSPVTTDGQSPLLRYQLPFKLTEDTENWVMNIGDNQTSSIDKPEPIFLNTNLLTNIGFYHLENADKSNLDLSQFPVQLCSNPAADQITASNRINDHALELIAKNVQSCLKIPLSQVITPSQLTSYRNLISFQFQASSSTGSQAHYCIYNHLLQRCIKEKKYLPNPTKITEYITLSPSDLDTLELVLYVDGVANNHNEKIIYQDFSYTISTPSGFVTVSPDEIHQSFQNQKLVMEDPHQLTINYQTSDLVDQVSIFEQGHISNSCSSVLPQQFDRTINPQGFIEYSSLQGSSCDYFSFPNLVHNIGYLVEVESQNVSGLPLRFCIANNTTKKCDLYLSLPTNKHFQKNVLLIPPTHDGGAGYNLHIDNYSVGNISSVNRLKNIRISPFPYQWISRINSATDNKDYPSNLIVSAVNQYSPMLTTVKFTNPGENYGLVTLNQTYEKGWWVFNTPHVKVNGWANGWVVKPGQKGTLVMIYLPQLLELLGMANVLALILYLWNFQQLLARIKSWRKQLANQTTESYAPATEDSFIFHQEVQNSGL